MRINTLSLLSPSLSALSAALMFAALPVTAASAQDSVADEDSAAEEPAQQIVVTGSRIARDPNATAPLPVNTINATELRNFGANDPTAALRQIPALVSSGTVADSIERGAGGIGQATLNLRQLGANRTLVLVDGYRHVSGVAGSQTVDVSTIPTGLIERVEVLTGGASAVYGADAVTGVVNYVLKKDYEGVMLDGQMGVSSRGDGRSYRLEGLVGKNFADGRGNVTLGVGYTKDNEVAFNDRAFTRDNGRANNGLAYDNPDLRFQRGDITQAATPNFFNFYNVNGGGGFPFGLPIPAADDIAGLFPGVTLTAAEQALIQRAATAPGFRIGRDPRFAISSFSGQVYRSDFAPFSLDINNNGTPDCQESYIGTVPFGGGGCYITTEGGGIALVEDGLIANETNQFGGNGSEERLNPASLIPGSERLYANFRANYEFSPAAEFFVDAKYTRNVTTSRSPYNTFYDLVRIRPANPFIPEILLNDAIEAGGLRVSRDNSDLGPGITEAERQTYRIVAGLTGDLSDNLRYELVGNYGRTENRTTFSNYVLADRYLAAVDAVRAPNGDIVCRSTLDPTATPQNLGFPAIRGGFFTFTPGANSGCVPINLFNGRTSTSQAAIDWITQPNTDRSTLEQTVITGILNGDTGAFFNLPGGAVAFALGGEYRKETSRTIFDDADLGILPASGPNPAGTNIADVTGNRNRNLSLSDQTPVSNTGGSFDVWEAFAEVNLPILSDRPFFEELTVGGAGRFAHYSTVGDTFTWNVNGAWAPIEDIRFRGTYGRAIRAPNIAELFNPLNGAVFRPSDPCTQANINRLAEANDPAAANRLANCRAAGIPEGFTDPNTGRFPGLQGGNPTLDEEKATTFTIGAVLQPRFIPGLTLSADYYSIKIENAIELQDQQDIVNTCYDLSTFPNQFCEQFTRSETTLGLNFLTRTPVNLPKIETRGIDFQANYGFALGENNFNLQVAGNWTERLNRFFDPARPDVANPGLRELSVPEWTGFGSAAWNRGALTVSYNLQYIGSTAVASAIQIERIQSEFGPAGFAPEYWVHGASFNLDATDQITFYGGVNNLTDEEPYIASSAYPVSGIGRTIFLGVTGRF